MGYVARGLWYVWFKKCQKDKEMEICKSIVVLFLYTLFGCFLWIPLLYVYCDLFQLLFFWKGGGRESMVALLQLVAI